MRSNVQRAVLMVAGLAAFAVGFAASANGEDDFGPGTVKDFVAGFGGDKAALDRAMAASEKALAANPKHAVALVWHGAGMYMRAGQAMAAGDLDTTIAHAQKGEEEMGRAVALEPDNIEVRTIRGATLIEATKHMDGNPNAPELLETGLKDYEHLLKLHEKTWSGLPDERKTDLLYRLAEGWDRAGNETKARTYYERLASELKDKRATEWLERKKTK